MVYKLLFSPLHLKMLCSFYNITETFLCVLIGKALCRKPDKIHAAYLIEICASEVLK